MKLLTLKITNFKSLRALTFQPKGMNACAYGINGSGKTTLADAPTWLLTGKDSRGRSPGHADFKIKPQDEMGFVIKGLNPEVEATYLLDGGEEITLRKVYMEEYKTSRGQANSKFDGHTVDHYINTVPVSKTTYEQRIEQICPLKQLPLLAIPGYFLSDEIKWEDRRRKLVDICGDVSDADIVAANPILAPLPAILGRHSIDEYRDILAEARKNVNKELIALPVRLDEASKSITEIPTGNYLALSEKLQTEIADLRKKRVEAEMGGLIANETIRLREIQSEMADIVNRLKSVGNPRRIAALTERRRVVDAINLKQGEKTQAESKVSAAEAYISKNSKLREELLTEHAAISKEAYAGGLTCPSCKQPLPESEIAEAVANFNLAKAALMAANAAKGTPLLPGINAATEKLVRHQADVATINAEILALETELAELLIPEDEPVDPNNDGAYKAKRDHMIEVEVKIAELRTGSSAALTAIDGEIAAKTAQAKEAAAVLSQIEGNRTAQARIAELEKQQEGFSADSDRIAKEQHLTDEFLRLKMDSLTDLINSKFALCRWKLFEIQVNGALKPICEADYNGAPPSTGEAINLGLDCINVLAAHAGIAPPIFVDFAESVTNVLPTVAQQIRLSHTPTDLDLRIEILETTAQETISA